LLASAEYSNTHRLKDRDAEEIFMSDEVRRLFEGFDCGRLSRRQLLQALGAAAVLAPVSALAAPVLRGEQTGEVITLAPAPFEPTGWKTILFDHISCKVADHEKEAAYYNALMSWGVRSNDAQETVLDIGDFGTINIRGGYQPSADEIAAEKTQFERRADAARKQGIDPGPFVPRNAVFDSFCWGIDQWDAKKVEAALKARGLNPVADNHGHDFESFHVKDPDGFDVQISNGNRHNPRAGAPKGHVSAAAPFDRTGWKTVWLDHISFGCTDYKKTVSFYQALLGWQPTNYMKGDQNQVRIGHVGDAIIRNRAGQGGLIDHISFGIAPFHPAEVKAGLEKRGLPARVDTGGRGAIETASFQSYHTQTPNGFDLQISNVTKDNDEPPF
jgi:catechol 2,3-dioxygenase-like lactoylglutathione lyase family enzyme